MNNQVYIILSAIMALLSMSCNHDVFVPDTTPSAMSLYLDGDGDSIDFTFTPKKLKTIRIYTGYHSVNAYDKSGDLVKRYIYDANDWDASEQYFDMPVDGRIEIFGAGITSLNIEQKESGKLRLLLDEFLGYSSLRNLKIELIYNNAEYTVPIYISSNSGYDLIDLRFDTADSTVYYFWDENPVIFTYSNNGSSESSALIDVYANEKNIIFYNFPPEAFQLMDIVFQEPYYFKYPTYSDGKIQFLETTIFGNSSLPISPEYYYVELPPMTTVCCQAYVQTCVVKVGSLLILRNVATHRIRKYSGTITTHIKVASKVQITKTPVEI